MSLKIDKNHNEEPLVKQINKWTNKSNKLSFHEKPQNMISECMNKLQEDIDFTKKENIQNFFNEKYSEFSENFELSDFIGCGSEGYVYKGFYKKNKRPVAIKFIKMKYNKNKEKLNTRINQEIDICKKLHNINIIETYAHVKINDNYNFYILEYGKNGDLEYFLKYLLRRSLISETAINYFCKQILDGLNYLHKKCKIVHMDIKPSNILIDSTLCAKITDFSVSCSYKHFDSNNLVKFPFVGTSKFMPPEIINETIMKVKEAEKIDIYSLGSTLYYLFFGYYPYKLNEVKGKDYDNILEKIKNENLEFPIERKISILFKDFLNKTLEKDYNKRINIKDALNHPWIKASQAIFNEKENLGNLESFLIKIITDDIPNFNNLIN